MMVTCVGGGHDADFAGVTLPDVSHVCVVFDYLCQLRRLTCAPPVPPIPFASVPAAFFLRQLEEIANSSEHSKYTAAHKTMHVFHELAPEKFYKGL